jgi:prepilin-type N-terminal cleavage/methylation domain-containing protein
MSHKKVIMGFTLIELLVAASIMGIISTVSVKLLFSTVLGKARQNSIQISSDDIRNYVSKLSKAVKEADIIIPVSSSELQIKGNSCYTFKMESGSLKYASDSSSGCTPPSSLETVTNTGDVIYKPGDVVNGKVIPSVFEVSDSKVDFKLSGKINDTFGKHDFSYNTIITKRSSN